MKSKIKTPPHYSCRVQCDINAKNWKVTLNQINVKGGRANRRMHGWLIGHDQNCQWQATRNAIKWLSDNKMIGNVIAPEV